MNTNSSHLPVGPIEDVVGVGEAERVGGLFVDDAATPSLVVDTLDPPQGCRRQGPVMDEAH